MTGSKAKCNAHFNGQQNDARVTEKMTAKFLARCVMVATITRFLFARGLKQPVATAPKNGENEAQISNGDVCRKTGS